MNDLFSPRTRAGIVARYYQVDDHDESFRLWDSGIIGVLTRAATGSGKTIMACLKMDTWLQRGDDYHCMVISYERQLVWQFAEEIEDVLGITPGIEMDKESCEPDAMPKIIVASRASLLRQAPPTPEQVAELLSFGVSDLGPANARHCKKLLTWLRKDPDTDCVKDAITHLKNEPEAKDDTWSRLHKFDWRKNWLLIFDEAHKHAYHLPSVGHIVDWFEQNPKHRRNGVTATPKRSDMVSIGDRMFPGISLDYPLWAPIKPCAVKDGYAVPYIQKYIEVQGVDFRSLAKLGEDFDENDVARQLGEEGTLAKLIIPFLDLVGTRKALIFNPGVEMSKNVMRFINARNECICECGKRKWYPKQLIGDGAACECGRLIDPKDITAESQCRQLDGDSPDDERKQIYKDHQAGKFQFLSVCGLCLAKDSRILTDCGEVPIQNVTKNMRLWDGIEFVSHGGVIPKGIMPVIEYAGLMATGDHNVWTDNGWERLAACKQRRTAVKVSGIGGKEIRESCGYYRGDHSTWKKSTGWLGSALQWLWENQHQVLQRAKNWSSWMQTVCKKLWRSELAIDALPLCKEAVRKSSRLLLSRLRGTWDQIPVCFTGGNGYLGDGTSRIAQGFDLGPQGQRPKLRTWEHPVGKSEGTSEQQAKTAKGVSSAEVFDILNAGPRHRFTANGLIVSNCREGYNDPDVSCVLVLRLVSKKASSLAEQMKGRSCRVLRSLGNQLHAFSDAAARCQAIAESAKPNSLIVDLVGITGLADCASTAQIYEDGLKDELKDQGHDEEEAARIAEEIAERAAEILAERGLTEEVSVEEAINQAKREDAEARERIRKEREQAEQRAREQAEKRAKADAQVEYKTQEVGYGTQTDPDAATDAQYRYCETLGMEIKVLRSKRQVGRIINMLKQRVPLEEIARQNKFQEDDWAKKGPSVKQLGFMRWKGIPTAGAKSTRDASLLIDAKLDTEKLMSKMQEAFSKAKCREDLDAIGKDCRLIHGVLSEPLWLELVEEGKRRRGGLQTPEDF